MRIFDYSFLESLILPENLSALVKTLRNMQSLWEKGAVHLPLIDSAPKTLQSGLPNLGQTLRAVGSESGKPTAKAFLRLMSLAGTAPGGIEAAKQSAIGQAFSAYFEAEGLGVDPLLLIPCLALDLICLSPLGQPRLGPALLAAQMFLCWKGFSLCKYTSLPEAICTYRAYYDRQFSLAAQRWEDYENDYLVYINLFLSLLYLSFRKALPLPAPKAVAPEPIILPEKPRKNSLKPGLARKTTKRVLVEELVLNSEQPISKADICAALPQISPTTVEAALGSMVKNGTVRRIGSTRAAKYLRN